MVLAVLALLTGLWLPALAGTASGGAAAGCLNNLRELVQAFLAYTEDHEGFTPRNYDDGWNYNWVGGSAGTGGAEEFNSELLQSPASSHLAPYLGRRAGPFRCPADSRMGLYRGTNVAWKGWKVPAARSYSMNGAIGTQRDGVTPVDGPWLDGNHTNRRNNPWRSYGRLSDMVEPAPSGLFVFLDEEPVSLNDGGFHVAMTTRWVDFPATHHQFGGGFGFADGHAVIHPWEDSRIQVRSPPFLPSSVMLNCPDLAWLQFRASARYR